MECQSHQNSSDQTTQKSENRSKNVPEEHKHNSEVGSEISGQRNDLPRQLLATHGNTLKANSEDLVTVEENIQSVQYNNVNNLRTEGSSLSKDATNIAQPLRKPKIKYQSVARSSEISVFTTTRKPPRCSRSISKKNQSKLAHASQRISNRRGYAEALPDCGITNFSGISHDHNVLQRAANLARDASCLACSSLFWNKVEPLFSSVREEDTSYLLKELELWEQLHVTQPHIPWSQENIRGTAMSTRAGESTIHHHEDEADYSSSGITLPQLALCALISEDEIEEAETDEEFAESNLQDVDETNVRKIQYDFSDIEYGKLDFNTRFQLEMQIVDLYPESGLSKEIDDEIVQLQQRLRQQTENKKSYLSKIYELVRRSGNEAKQ